jgi:hypothetical protein
MKAEDALDYERRLNDLDVEHKRARSPAQRKRVERKMRQLRDDLVKLKVLEARVDAAAKKWWADIEKRLVEALASNGDRTKGN